MHGAPPQELYDLEADPGETRNLADARPEVRDELDGRLQSWIEEQLRRSGRTEDPLVAQGPSLAKRWQQWAAEKGNVDALAEDLR
jgi:arylsulfatase A-like enzyme